MLYNMKFVKNYIFGAYVSWGTLLAIETEWYIRGNARSAITIISLKSPNFSLGNPDFL